MKLRHMLLQSALVASAALSSVAMAEGYVGGAIGQSDADFDCAGATSCDTKDTAFKVYGGYMFIPYFGVEAAYFNLGKSKATFGSLSEEVKVDGFALYGVGAVPLSDFLLFAKLGVASTKVKDSGNFFASESDTNTNVAWGIGAGYNFMKNLGARIEWERFRPEFQGEKVDVDVISLGVHYRF